MAKKFFIFSLLCLLAIAAQALLPRPGHLGQPRQNKLPGPGPEALALIADWMQQFK